MVDPSSQYRTELVKRRIAASVFLSISRQYQVESTRVVRSGFTIRQISSRIPTPYPCVSLGWFACQQLDHDDQCGLFCMHDLHLFASLAYLATRKLVCFKSPSLLFYLECTLISVCVCVSTCSGYLVLLLRSDDQRLLKHDESKLTILYLICPVLFQERTLTALCSWQRPRSC